MKKVLSTSLLILLLISALSSTAFAFGGHHGGRRNNAATKYTAEQQTVRQTWFEICETEDCDTAGPHQHDDTWYCSQHYLQDGLGLCPADDCTIRGIHEHDDIYYHCSYYGTGLDCRNNGTEYRAKRHCR